MSDRFSITIHDEKPNKSWSFDGETFTGGYNGHLANIVAGFSPALREFIIQAAQGLLVSTNHVIQVETDAPETTEYVKIVRLGKFWDKP